MPRADARPAITIGLLAAGLCALQIHAFHWGVITPDTVIQYGQALSGRYDDWHPPVTAWLWRQLGYFGPGGAPFLICDSLLYWGAMALIAGALKRGGGWPAVAAVFVLAALPIGFGQIGAILKDPLMACLLLMASALLLWRERAAGRARIALAVPAVALIVVASATRFNAAFAAIPLLLLLAPRWTATASRLCASALLAGLLLVATGWMINVVALDPHRSHPIYSLLNFDMAGIGAHGGGNVYPSLSDDVAARLTARCYDPRLYGANPHEDCAPAEDSLADYARIHHVGPIGLWLRAIASAPLPYVEHRLAHLNWNWRFLLSAVPDDAFYAMSQPNDLGLHFERNPLTRAIIVAGRIMAWSPIGRPITWLCIAFGLILIAPRLPNRRFVTAIAMSALLYGGAYALVSVAPDLRYNLWTMLAVMAGGAVAFADRRAAVKSIGKWRLYSAFAPAAIAMVLEMAALLIGRLPA
jgi:hypothetical protein